MSLMFAEDPKQVGDSAVLSSSLSSTQRRPHLKRMEAKRATILKTSSQCQLHFFLVRCNCLTFGCARSIK